MKNLILVLTLAASTSFAVTINSQNGDLYQGDEYVNEQATGKTCYLYVDYIDVNPVGKYCYNLTTRPVFSTDRNIHPKDEIVVMGHITNFHRPEYPKIKTCAMSLDGKTSGNDIYGDDDTTLYNQLFSWEGNFNGNQFDFFVTLSADTKKPSRTRLHRMNWMSETDYDCLNLQKL
jgi:hypothetical protein